MVVANLIGDDIILCQITSKSRVDDYSILLYDEDFEDGKLNLISLIRPNRLFTADKSIVKYKIGSLKNSKKNEVENKIVKIFKD